MDKADEDTPISGYISFDLELKKGFEMDDEGNFKDFETLIPSCMAYTLDGKNVSWWWDKPYLTVEKARRFVTHIRKMIQMGYIPVTWNGTAFDWRVLAHYTGMMEECSEIALFSYDLMLAVTFRKGYYLGLEKALIGAELPTKLHTVTLNDGTVLTEMSGKLAPDLWERGEYQAVLDYLKDDVIQPYWLTKKIEETKRTQWTANSGRKMSCSTPLQTVLFLYNLPEPDTSWMKGEPPSRKKFIEWMPKHIIEKYYVGQGAKENYDEHN